MSSDDEWKQFKLDCLEYLRGHSFQLADYTAPNAEWDHDHWLNSRGLMHPTFCTADIAQWSRMTTNLRKNQS